MSPIVDFANGTFAIGELRHEFRQLYLVNLQLN
jgi:hypothetical protein